MSYHYDQFTIDTVVVNTSLQTISSDKFELPADFIRPPEFEFKCKHGVHPKTGFPLKDPAEQNYLRLRNKKHH